MCNKSQTSSYDICVSGLLVLRFMIELEAITITLYCKKVLLEPEYEEPSTS